MNFAVCVKPTPATDSKVEIKEGKVDDSNFKFEISPYDDFAVEEAVALTEKAGDGKVYAFSVGDKEDAIKRALILGAHEARHLKDAAFAGSDAAGVANILAAGIKKQGDIQVVFCGRQGVDLDQAQTGILLAEALGWPHVGWITRLEISGDSATGERQIEGGTEVWSCSLPAVFTANKGLNKVRHPNLKNIMASKKKPRETWGAADLGIDTATVGAGGSKLNLKEVFFPPPKPEGKIVQGDPADTAAQLAAFLHEETKLI